MQVIKEGVGYLWNSQAYLFIACIGLVLHVLFYMNRTKRKVTFPEDYHVIIIGGGISGIGTGYYFKQKGIRFTIFEKNEELGGTWLSQKFHGVRFDSFHTQTLFSFEPMNCPPMCDGPRFLQYLIDTAKKYGIYERVFFNEAVKSINYNTEKKMWKVKTSKSEYEANFVVNANGYYDDKNPHIPDIFKNTNFKGKILHSFNIDQSKLDTTQDDVVLVGSGATAITMIPELVKCSKSVTMIQRSPSFVVQANFGQYPFYPTCNWLYHKGITLPWRIYRLLLCIIAHKFMGAMVHSVSKKGLRQFHKRQIRYYTSMKDSEIDKHFEPKYNFGEQRPLVSLGFIEAIPKIKLYTNTISKVTEEAIVLSDNTEVKADTIILATGFNLDYFKFDVLVDGKPINMYDLILRRDTWFEGIPNFCNMVLFARLDSKNYTCFTPLLEHSATLLCKALEYMVNQRATEVYIKPKHSEPGRYYPMSSSYFMRNQDKCFKADPNEHSSLGTAWRIAFGYEFNPEDFLFV